MDLGIAGKLALVVGASKSIGAAVAKELSEEGCNLILSARDAPRLYKLAESLSGVEVFVAPCDVTTNLTELLMSVSEFSGRPDIIVHCVGGSGGIKDANSDAKDFHKVWTLNLGHAIDINVTFIPQMIRKGWGRVVHISSHATHRHIGYVPYTSAKHALEGYVKNMGKDLAKTGVVMSAIRPGPIYNEGRYLYSQAPEWTENYIKDFVPAGRWGRAEEAAKAIAFLCSEGASYMNGSIVDVDAVAR